MAVWSEVCLMDITQFRRADSEYFHPKYEEAEVKVLKGNTSSLGALGSFKIGPFGSAFIVSNYDKNSGYRYVRGKDVKSFFLLNNDSVYMPKNDFVRLSQYALEKEDLLISVVGTLGNVCIVPDDIKGIFSCKSTVFRKTKISPYFLLAYFNSDIGRLCLVRRQRGAVQTGLNKEDLKTVPVPIVDSTEENQISTFVKKALQKRKLSQSLYTQAQELLEQELGLNKLKFEKPVGYEASFSEVVNNRRVDAEYSKPKYKIIIQHLKKFNLKKLKDIASLNSGYSFSSDKYSKTGIQIVRIQNISGTIINLKRNPVFYPKIYEKELQHFIVKKNNIFMAMTGNTIGKCSLNTTEKVLFLNQRVLSITSISNDIKPEYLHLFLSNNIFQSFIERELVGGAQPNISMEFIGNQLIPILDSSIQTKISNLIIESHQTKRESQQLLEQAKSRVEQLIEEAAGKNGGNKL